MCKNQKFIKAESTIYVAIAFHLCERNSEYSQQLNVVQTYSYIPNFAMPHTSTASYKHICTLYAHMISRMHVHTHIASYI